MIKELENAILDFCLAWDSDEARENFKTGLSVSYLISKLKDLGYKNLGNNSDFCSIIEKIGFSIVPGRTKNGFHKSIRVIRI